MMEKDWWKGKVAYQIYPKSFNDSNGDGIGDLKGITEKLDYLQGLGIDILWLSPVYKSPFVDQGYDIADYYAIDPQFGTMEDMEELIAEAKKHGISIIMDLVVNHYYLHSFHKGQPDLNWQNPVVREEIYTMINWWLEKGIGGFRIDAIINIKKDLEWRSLPSEQENGLVPVRYSLANAQPIEPFLQEMKEKTFARYNAFTVGEVFNETDEELHFFIGEEGVFSSIFDFKQTILGQKGNGWYSHDLPTAEELKDSIFKAHRRADSIGVLSTIIENHDEPRGVSHYIPEGEVTEISKKALATVQMLRKGIPFIYQGQEIGMENQIFESIDEFDDINTLNEYHVAKEAGLTDEEALKAISKYSRDNARTPMQWNGEEKLGFTTGEAWLVSKQPQREINVEEQEENPQSILNYYRALTALYRDEVYGSTIREGEFVPVLEEVKNMIAYERRGEKRVLVLVNYQAEPQTVTLPTPVRKVLLANIPAQMNGQGDQLFLAGYQALVCELEG